MLLSRRIIFTSLVGVVMNGPLPRWCAPDCEHASFPEKKHLDGACHTFIALYCSKYNRLVQKSALCLDYKHSGDDDND